MKKLTFISAIAALTFMGIASANPKGEKNPETKMTEAVASPSESRTADAFVYYVVGRNDDDDTYQLSTTPPANCGTSGNSPCKITTTTDQSTDLEMPQSDVDGGVGVTINSRHNL